MSIMWLSLFALMVFWPLAALFWSWQVRNASGVKMPNNQARIVQMRRRWSRAEVIARFQAALLVLAAIGCAGGAIVLWHQMNKF